jgi:predicted nucleotidyltransferase
MEGNAMIENLSPAETQALTDLAVIAGRMNTPLMLVGANARRLAFDIPFGFASPRSTRDWDFAAPMRNWATFSQFHQIAVEGETALFRPGQGMHRIIHSQTGVLIDIVPFGQVADDEMRICWPQSNQSMSVLGFEEAYDSSLRQTLPSGTEIRIIVPAMLTVLKLIAFSERGESLSRDRQDVWFIMERYARPTAHENRVFEELSQLFPDDNHYEHLHSLLLGWDIGHQCRASTLAALEIILNALSTQDARQVEPLLPRTLDIDERQARHQMITAEFGWLQKGIQLAAGRI